VLQLPELQKICYLKEPFFFLTALMFPYLFFSYWTGQDGRERLLAKYFFSGANRCSIMEGVDGY